MEETQLSTIASSAFEKANLIHNALETLRAAQCLDERDDLTAATWVAWYDATIPDVRDIKILAGAMEIELAKRRGERILQEGERRGGDVKSDSARIKVTGSVTLISEATRAQRKKDRLLAIEAETVKAYVQREAKAKRIPSKEGAMRTAIAARAGRASHAPHVVRAPRAISTPERRVEPIARGQRQVEDINRKILAALDQLADDVRRSDAQLTKVTGNIHSFLERVRLIPWLTIDRTSEGTLFRIDSHLRAICDGLQPRRELSYTSIANYLHTLREQLTRKRKENRDERRKTRWDSTLILTRVQSDMLDWIEEQLDRVPYQ